MSAEAKLHSARKELLDLGLRNPLLNYRTFKARGLEIVDEKPAELYPLLVQKHTHMAFLERPDAAPDAADLTQPEEPHDEDKYTDNNLQTAYDSAVLQKRLLHTYHTAHTYMEEHGVNILYLALGMLQWYEDENSEKRRRAPLVLIPVQLDRLSAAEKFRVAYTFEEVSFNLSLEAKLRIDYGLQLPALPAEDAFDLGAYFAEVEALIAEQPRWSVDRDAAVVAFFSFTKLLMFNDLDPDNWPEGQSPAEHPVIRSLLSDEGFLEPPVSTTADMTIDQRMNVHYSHLVMDADSSQALAILDVNDGRNLVIQGPPGTGKSQTITNIIAEAVGNGKTVLFVSEKMAALNVVKRRLDGLGLGDGALELHSHKATKGSVMAEIGRTMALGQPKNDGDFKERFDLRRTTQRLNDYATALNTPIRESGVTPYEAYGRLIQRQQLLDGVALPDGSKLIMFSWSAEEYGQYHQHVREVQTHLGRMGVPRQHPFYGSMSDQHQPDSDRLIREMAGEAADSLTTLRRHTAELVRQFGMNAPQTVKEIEQIIGLGERLTSAPNLFALDVDNKNWYAHAPQITAALDAGSRIAELQQKYDDVLIPAAWTQDVFAIRQPIAVHGERVLKFLSRDYRRAKNTLLGLCRSGLPEDPADQLALVDAILEVQEHHPTVKNYEGLLTELFGARWNGIENTKWYDLLDAGYWAIRLHREINEEGYPAEILGYLGEGFDVTKRDALAAVLSDAVNALAQYQKRWGDLRRLIMVVAQERPLDEQEQLLRRYAHEAARFGEWVTYQQLTQAHSELGLLWPEIEDWAGAGHHLVTFFEHAYYQQLIDITLKSTPILGSFEGQTQETAVELFQHLDNEFLRHNRYRLAYEHWERMPKFAAEGQVGLLQHESGKRRNHLPIRQLITAAGPAIQRLKPIFMMSPLSVAMFLPPGLVEFDLVVFDEASQVRPVDAFGAIVRGRQVVVVGDSKQMPPTSFFDRVLTGGGREEEGTEGGEELDGTEGGVTESNESILDLFVGKNAPQRMLRWHYRSRHESLIGISNREFYHNQLMLFPSPDAARKETGLKLRYLPDTVYDRGGTRTNVLEARAVAGAVMAHARTRPNLTLGVAAFSTAQREAIETELEKLRRESAETEPFFDAHTAEPFFVKNLENVQGDERDVIFISIGYGRDGAGKVNLNFGPLNPAGGERRLNVLITRSRRRCEVFTNIRAEDIDLRRTGSHGIAALKAYLAYAESGELEELAPAVPHETAAFEQVIVDKLAEAGYSVAQNVGNNGVVIDLAVRDPREPERYLVGILCDGDSYGRALYARDRDRIQPNVLNGLGWHIQRVWSTSWVNGVDAAAEKLISAVNEIAAEGYAAELAPRIVPKVERYAAKKPKARKAKLYKPSGLRIDLYNRDGWQPGEHVGKFESVHYYRFDPDIQQFVNRTKSYNKVGLGKRLERLEQWGKQPIPDREHVGEIYARLVYHMNTGRFTLSEGRGEFLSGGKRYSVFFNHDSKRFYASQQSKGLDAKSRHVPVSRGLEEAVRLEAKWVGEIIAAEGPIHQDELERRLAAAGGQGRRTAVMAEFVNAAGKLGIERGEVEKQGEFWLSVKMGRLEVRDRSKLPSVSRKLEYVSDMELAEGVKLTVEDGIAIEAGEIVPAVRRLLGFGSLGKQNQKRILMIVADLLERGELTVYGEEVTLPVTSGRAADGDFIAKVRQAVALEEKKKAELAIARVKGGLPTFTSYQNEKTFPNPYAFVFNGEDEDGERVQISWSSMRERVLSCHRWFGYEPEFNRFLNKIAGRIDGRRYADLPVGDKLRGQKWWYGRLRYDLVEGAFLHDGYLTMFVDNWVRSDDQYRMWRDPEDGALLGRRVDEKKVRGGWFSHGNVRYLPISEKLEDIKSRNCRSLDDAVTVEREFARYMKRMEQGKLLEIIREEGPVHHKVVESRLAAGSQTDKAKQTEWATANRTIRAFVARVSQEMVADGLIRIVGDFYWPVEMRRPVVRSRAGAHRKLQTTEYIAPEELCEAIVAIVRERPVTGVEELPNLVGMGLLGKRKLGKKEAEPVQAALQWLIGNEYVKQEDGVLAVAEDVLIDWPVVHRGAGEGVPAEVVDGVEQAAAEAAEAIVVRPYARTNTQFEPYKIVDWTHMEAGQFSSQHYYGRDPQSGRFVMDGRVKERTVLAGNFETYRETHKKLVFDGRHGTFYEHGGGRPLATVDEQIEQMVKEPLLSVVTQIVTDEGPIHYEEVSRSLAHAAGRSTRSNILVLMAEWAADELWQEGVIQREGAFFWPLETGADELVVRDRSDLPKVSQSWAFVAPAEMAQALVGLAASGTQTRSHAPTAVAQLLGLARPRGEALDLIKALIDDLIEGGHVREERGVLWREPAEAHILTLREVARLAELTEAEGDAPKGDVPNLYLPSRPTYAPYQRPGWEKIAEGVIESRHYYLFDAENELFVLDNRLRKGELLGSRMVVDGFEAATSEWGGKIYVKLRYDLRTDEFSHGNGLWLATLDRLYEGYCDGDLSDGGRVYVRTVEAREGECDRVYDPQTGALTLVERPFVIADAPEFCPAWVHRDLAEVFHEPEVQAVQHVVFYERPVHVDEVAQRLMDAAGLTDQRVARLAVQSGIVYGSVIERDKFLWPVGVVPEIKVRVRSGLPSEARLVRYVADEALAEGVLQVLVAEGKPLTRAEVQKLLPELFGIAPLTSLEGYRLEKLVAEMVTAGLLQQAADERLIVAEPERFRGQDGLPTAVVAPEVMRGVRPYAPSSAKIESMLDREGWYSHVTTELWSRDYYRFDVAQWRFVFERVPESLVEQFRNLPHADQIPEAGKVYAQLHYDLVTDSFRARPYLFYLKTNRRNYRLSIDLGKKQFYVDVVPSKGGDKSQRGHHFIDPDSGEATAVNIREINLGMVDTQLITEIESVIETQMRRPDVAYIEQIVRAEQPVHEDVLRWRFAQAAGLPAGNKVAAQLVTNTLGYLVGRFDVRVIEGMVTWRDWDGAVAVRSRAGLAADEQQLRLVSAAELDAAVLLVLGYGSYVRFEQVVVWVMKVLGVRPLGKVDEQLVVAALERLVGEEKVRRFGNFWVVGAATG